MASVQKSGTFTLGDRTVYRLGYGAMQLAGPGVFGPPKDRGAARDVLRKAVAQGVNHIDTSDFYGPHVTNQIIREALHPYSDDLTIVTKVSARRGADGSWIPAMSPHELTLAVHDNLRNLGLDVLDVVNLRSMFDVHGPAEGSLEAPLSVLAELQRKGLVRHIGLSNVTPTQIAEGRKICQIVCVQNYYNLAHRDDDALIDDLAGDGTAYVPFFPLGGFNPLQSSTLSAAAARLGATPMQVALGWMLRRAPNILLTRHLVGDAFEGKSGGGRDRFVRRCHQGAGGHRKQSRLMASESRRRSTWLATSSLAASQARILSCL
jgi:pyridoxine 4-dehydrogenase